MEGLLGAYDTLSLDMQSSDLSHMCIFLIFLENILTVCALFSMYVQ